MTERTRTFVLLIAVVAVCVGGAWWWRAASSKPSGEPQSTGGVQRIDVQADGIAPRAGESIGNFVGIDVEGKRLSLEQLRGKPLWLTFGASWCTGCRTEARDIQDTFTAHQGQGLQVVAVYVREDTQAAKTYADRVGLTFTHIPDPDAKLAARYHAQGVPMHYFVDAEGTVRDVVVGVLSQSQMEEKVRSISR